MPQFAANLSLLFTEAPFLDRFALAREAGFDGVEFLFPYAFDAHEIGERLRQHRLHLALFNLPAGDWAAGERGIACDPRRVAEFRDGVVLALDYAQALGVRQLHCLAGIVPPDVGMDEARTVYLDNLRYAADALRARGLRLLIEPINHFDIPGYFLTGSRQARDIIDILGADNIFLQYDVYHMQRMEGELAATLRAHLPRIAHIQVADNPGRHEPGSGEINYAFLFRLLDTLGYTGWIGCEYHPTTTTAAGLGWRAQLCKETP